MIETLEKTEKYSSWIIEMPPDIARQEGYAEGSKVILTFQNGKITSEILPPTSKEVKSEVNRIIEKYDGKSEQSAKRFINKYSDFMKEVEDID